MKDQYEYGAFYGYTGLKKITIPKIVTRMYNSTFLGSKVIINKEKNSYAQKFAKEHKIKFHIV